MTRRCTTNGLFVVFFLLATGAAQASDTEYERATLRGVKQICVIVEATSKSS